MPEQPVSDTQFQQMQEYVKAVENEQDQRDKALKIANRRLQVSIDEQAETAKLRQDIRLLMQYYQQHALKEDAMRDMFENLSTRMERIEHGQMLTLMDRLEGPSVRAQATEVVVGHAESLAEQSRRRELAKRQANLAKLKEQAANYASIDIPLDLQNRIAAETEAISGL